MAHHIFRRCLLADVVPPLPVVGGDYRLFVGANFGVAIDVTGVELGTSVAGLDVLSGLQVQPIPPGVDTGLAYYRLEVGLFDGGFVIGIPGVEINGTFAAGGIVI